MPPTADAFARSAQKFGARIVADQHFKPGTDPREREQNDPALLSAINRDFDVVFVADDAFDFARTVPYHTVLPRPVVGSIDLEPVAWHWTWEHNGAPQVNSRFEKKSGGRRMDGADWAAWLSVKMIVQSVLRTGSAEFAKQRDFILGDGSFDGDKGLPVGVRPWDHQVRQAMLLAAPYEVVASAPIEGLSCTASTNSTRSATTSRKRLAIWTSTDHDAPHPRRLRALQALTVREMTKFVQQRGRLLSALVRPLIWLAVFAAGFYNVFGVSIIPPYKTYVTYQVYIVPGLLGMILLFHGMQSSLSMVYDREMGVMRLLLTAPLPRWVLLACKLVAGTALSVLTCYVFLAVCILFDVTFDAGRLACGVAGADRLRTDARRAVAVPVGLHPPGGEFRRRDEFRDVSDVLLLLRALSAVAAARGRLRASLLHIARQSVHLCGGVDPLRALRRVRADCRFGRDRRYGAVLSAGSDRLRSAARSFTPRCARTAGLASRPRKARPRC